jgi:F-type H+-transporting ATPase subunit b
MGDTLHALGGILLRATPTFFLVFLLTVYLKKVFFKPLEKVLEDRYQATEGARKLAEETTQRASVKAAEYEAAVRAARTQIYQAQEQTLQELQEKRAADAAAARERAGAQAREAKTLLAADVEAAKAALAAEVEPLANEIAASLLRRSAA